MKSAKDIIKQREGLRLKAYRDAVGILTIGWGHTRNVHADDVITEAQAEAFLEQDMADAYEAIDRFVTVPLSNPQREALCSFIYNVGGGAFQKSTLLRLLNAGDYSSAAAQFDRWNKAGGVVLRGLTTRRKEEKALFLAGTHINPEPIPPLEEPMAPFLLAAIPALIQALPDFAKLFKNPDVAERNVDAVVKASEIIMQATGSTNVQEAVEKIQTDPEVKAAANDAVRLNNADLLDAFSRAWDKDEASVAAARDFSREDKPVVGRWLFVHIISMLFSLLGGGAAFYVLVTSTDATERAMALQALLLTGFAGVAAFWLGSSRSSQVKDLMRN